MPKISRLIGWQKLALFDRYLFRQLLPPFLWGMGAFSSIGVSAAVLFDLLRQVSEAQLPVAIALMILALQLPYFISLAIPMSVLLACLLALSRMQGDGELMAFQSFGINLNRLVSVCLSFALVACLLMLGLTEGMVPQSQTHVQRLLVKTLHEGQFALQDRHIIYQDRGPNQELRRLFYAQFARGQTLSDITVIDWSMPTRHQVLVAKSATWEPERNLWNFEDGSIYATGTEGGEQYVIQFSKQELQLPPQSSFTPDTSNLSGVPLIQAQRMLAQLRQTRRPAQIRALEIQLHRKLSLPFTVIVFGLVGSGMGIRQRRIVTSSGFGMSLIVVLGQYSLIFIADALGQVGVIAPWLGAWLPNIVTGLIGVGLMLRLSGNWLPWQPKG